MMMIGIGIPISQASAPFMGVSFGWLVAGTTPGRRGGSPSFLSTVDKPGKASHSNRLASRVREVLRFAPGP